MNDELDAEVVAADQLAQMDTIDPGIGRLDMNRQVEMSLIEDSIERQMADLERELD